MKRFTLAASILIMGYGFGHSQNFTNELGAVISVTASVYPDAIDFLDDITPESKKEQQKYQDNLSHLEQLAYEKIYREVTEQLNESEQANFHSLSELEDYLSFNLMGYPNSLIPKSSVKKLNKQGFSADYYASLYLSVDKKEIPIKDIMKEAKLAGKEGDFIYPEITVRVILFDKTGKKIQKLEKVTEGTERIFANEFSGGRFDKLEREHIDELWGKITPLIETTVNEALSTL